MSDIEERVKKIVVEHLGVEEAKIQEFLNIAPAGQTNAGEQSSLAEPTQVTAAQAQTNSAQAEIADAQRTQNELMQ